MKFVQTYDEIVTTVTNPKIMCCVLQTSKVLSVRVLCDDISEES